MCFAVGTRPVLLPKRRLPYIPHFNANKSASSMPKAHAASVSSRSVNAVGNEVFQESLQVNAVSTSSLTSSKRACTLVSKSVFGIPPLGLLYVPAPIFVRACSFCASDSDWAVYLTTFSSVLLHCLIAPSL